MMKKVIGKSNLILSVFLILVFCSCNKNKHDSLISRKIDVNDTVINDTLLKLWRTDTFGCKRKRNPKIAEILFKKYNLKGKTSNKVIEILGKPNEFNKETMKTYGVIKYYYFSSCDNNKLINEYYPCVIVFEIKDNIVVEFGYSCN